jgi:hypothetical protein
MPAAHIEDRSEAELRRGGSTVLDWGVVKGRIIAPAPLAGLELDNTRQWRRQYGKSRPLDSASAPIAGLGSVSCHARSRRA